MMAFPGYAHLYYRILASLWAHSQFSKSMRTSQYLDLKGAKQQIHLWVSTGAVPALDFRFLFVFVVVCFVFVCVFFFLFCFVLFWFFVFLQFSTVGSKAIPLLHFFVCSCVGSFICGVCQCLFVIFPSFGASGTLCFEIVVFHKYSRTSMARKSESKWR